MSVISKHAVKVKDGAAANRRPAGKLDGSRNKTTGQRLCASGDVRRAPGQPMSRGKPFGPAIEALDIENHPKGSIMNNPNGPVLARHFWFVQMKSPSTLKCRDCLVQPVFDVCIRIKR